MRRATTAFACMTLLPRIACAFQPLVTDDTGTQGAGGNQIESSYNRTVNKAPGMRTATHGLPLAFTRGITDALDLHLSIPYQKIVPQVPEPSERGWSNTVLGAKWRFYENEARKLSFALKPEVRLPVSKGTGGARIGHGKRHIRRRLADDAGDRFRRRPRQSRR